MSEEELNERYIRDKIQGICQDCIYLDKIIPIIRKMLSERYISGLKQGHFDKEMDKQSFIKWLEDKIEEMETDDVDDEELKGYLIQRIDTFKEILNKVKEL